MNMIDRYLYTFNMTAELGIYDKPLIVQEYGSSVYGTTTTKSDIDLVYITLSEEDYYDIYQSKDYHFASKFDTNIDLHLISKNKFQMLLNEHDIMALEIYYQFNNIERKMFNFSLDLDKLRRRVSAICGNSWSKARKKLEIPEEDDYIALKSLFHSIRILSYGIDLAETGNIDFKNVLVNGNKIKCSELLKMIMSEYDSGWNWKEFKEKYTPIQNKNATEFRKIAPLTMPVEE